LFPAAGQHKCKILVAAIYRLKIFTYDELPAYAALAVGER